MADSERAPSRPGSRRLPRGGSGRFCLGFATTAGRSSGTFLQERLGQTRALVIRGASRPRSACCSDPSRRPSGSPWRASPWPEIGLANIFPMAIGRAGALAGPSGVAAASTLGYTAACCWARPRSVSSRTGSAAPRPDHGGPAGGGGLAHRVRGAERVGPTGE